MLIKATDCSFDLCAELDALSPFVGRSSVCFFLLLLLLFMPIFLNARVLLAAAGSLLKKAKHHLSVMVPVL